MIVNMCSVLRNWIRIINATIAWLTSGFSGFFPCCLNNRGLEALFLNTRWIPTSHLNSRLIYFRRISYVPFVEYIFLA